jgi:ribosomal protein S6--L-glutamate ligase
VQDLLRAAESLQLQADVLDFRHLSAATGQAWHETAEPLLGYQAALVRTVPAGSLEQIIFRMDWLQAAALRGVPIVNSPKAVEVCVDKYLTSVRLTRAGLPTPPTFVAQRTQEAMQGFEALGGDVVIKPLFGAEGRGLQRISDPELAWRTFRVLENTGQVIYLQKYVAHRGYDIRAFVLGNKVLAAMQRHAQRGNWRTNIAQGGSALPCQVCDTISRLACLAAQAVHCTIAGVDLLRDCDDRWWVLEVNAVPGWKALSATCQIDVAREIWRYVIQLSLSPQGVEMTGHGNQAPDARIGIDNVERFRDDTA